MIKKVMYKELDIRFDIAVVLFGVIFQMITLPMFIEVWITLFFVAYWIMRVLQLIRKGKK